MLAFVLDTFGGESLSQPGAGGARTPGTSAAILRGIDDRLYFRQLLVRPRLRPRRPVARQMVNFVYLIGDRETGEAVVVDPAYDVDGILDVARAPTACASPARWPPTTTPTTSAARSWATRIEGVRELLALQPGAGPRAADEAPWVQRSPACRRADLVAARRRRHRAWSATSRSS